MSQYNPRFTLKSSQSEKKEIVLRLYFEYKTFTWNVKDSIGRVLKIYPQLWDTKNQYPIPKSKIPLKFRHETYNLQIIGETINNVKVLLNEIINEAVITNKTIDNNLLRKELNTKMGFLEKKSEISIYQFCLKTITEMQTGVLLINSTKRYTKGTIDKYIYTAQILEVYKPNTTFYQIDKDWYNGFISFLTNKQSITYKDKEGNEKLFEKKDLQPGSISNYVKNLKFLMSYAVDMQISNNRNHTEKWFIRPKNNSSTNKTDLSLNENEIKQLYDLHVNDKGSSLAKDLFLIGCYTGLRVSDFNSGISNTDFIETTNENKEAIKILVKTTKKTKETVYIPLLWNEINVIFEKYSFNMPIIEDQTINKYIKQMCQKLGSLSDKMQWNEVIGGKNVTVEKEKWELVTNHTARRSFISNMLKRGFTEKEIGYITGHKSKEIISQYDKLSGKEKAIMIYNKFQKSKISQ